MVSINEELCIGCGSCARDCFAQCIELRNKKARYIPEHHCLECGHCVAVCPRNAVSMPTLDMTEVVPLKDIAYKLDPDVFSNHILARRTIRSFAPTPVTKDQVESLLEIGRFSPTGGNRQDVAYNVLQKRVPEYRELVLTELNRMGEAMATSNDPSAYYGMLWKRMYEAFQRTGADRLFFGAGTVIVISSDSPQAAMIAAAHMETMVYAMGLGMLYSGFSTRAAVHSETVQQFLRLPDGYQVWATLVIGTPKPKYLRTVPRKPAMVTWE